MSIGSLADYRSALKQNILIQKSPPSLVNAGLATSLWAGGGTPSAGGSPGNTANGIVPASPLTGVPAINFQSGIGYITRVDYAASSGCRAFLYDRLFHCGAYTSNTGTTSLSGQPSFSSRIPGGVDYSGLQIWAETQTSGTGTPVVSCTYTNSAGVSGQSSGSVTLTPFPDGRAAQLPLAAGDVGVQTIESVTLSGSNATIVLFVARPLWSARIEGLENGWHWLDRTGAPQVWATSCLAMLVVPDSGTAPTVTLEVEIASL